MFTPGPWSIKGPAVGKPDVAGDYAIVTDGEVIIAETFHQTDFNTFQDAESNARLIAASPNMIERLKSVESFLKQYIEEAGPCDHEVNICVCDLIREAEQIAEIIKEVEGK